MKVQEKVKNDLKEAMLQKNEEKKSILRVLIGEFNREGKEVSDDKAIGIIKKMVINAKDQKNINEQTILEGYLPKQMSKSELKEVCETFINTLDSPTMKDMGKVMSYLKNNFSGLYDGKSASTFVKELLT